MGNLCSSGAEREKKEDASGAQLPDKPGEGEGDALLPKLGEVATVGGGDSGAGGLLGAGKNALEGVVDTAKEEGEKALEQGKEKGQAVVEEVVAKVEEGVKSAAAKVTGKLGDAEAESQKVVDDANKGVAQVEEAGQGLGGYLDQAGQKADGGINAASQKVDEGISEASVKAGSVLDSATSKFSSEVEKGQDASASKVTAVQDKVEQQAADLCETAQSAVTDGQAKVQEALSSSTDQLQEALSSSTDQLQEALSSSTDQLQEASGGIQQRAENWINEAVDAAKVQATSMMSGGEQGKDGGKLELEETTGLVSGAVDDVVTRVKSPDAEGEGAGGECFLDKARSLLETHRNSVDSGKVAASTTVQSVLDSGTTAVGEALESGKAAAGESFDAAVDSGKAELTENVDSVIESGKSSVTEAFYSGQAAAGKALESAVDSGTSAGTDAVENTASQAMTSAAGALSLKENSDIPEDSAASPEHEVAREFVESILDKATQLVSQEKEGEDNPQGISENPTVDRGEETLEPKKRGVMFVSPQISQEKSPSSPSPSSPFPSFSPPDVTMTTASDESPASPSELPTPPPTPPTLRASMNTEDTLDHTNNNFGLVNNVIAAVSPTTDSGNDESMTLNSPSETADGGNNGDALNEDDESLQRVAMEVTNKAVQDAIKIVTENGNGNNNHNTILTNNNNNNNNNIFNNGVSSSTGASPVSSPDELTATDGGSPTSDLLSDTSGGVGSVSESLSSYDPASTFRQDGVTVSGDASAAAAAASKVCDAVSGHAGVEDLPPPPPSPPTARASSTVNGDKLQEQDPLPASPAAPAAPTEVPSSLPDALSNSEDGSSKPMIVIDSPDCAHNTDNLPVTSEASDAAACAATEALI